jgi:hypothetical protein
MWESLAEAYGEAVQSAFPLHRAVFTLMAFLTFAVVPDVEHRSSFLALVHTELESLEFGDHGRLGSVTIGAVMVSVLLAFGGVAVSRLLRLGIFRVAAGAIEYEVTVKRAIAAMPPRPSNVQDLKAAIELLNTELKPTMKPLRASDGRAEFFASISLALAISAYWSGLVDGCLSAGSLLLVVVIHSLAIRRFLAECLPLVLYKRVLLGKKTPPEFGVE